MSEGLIETLPAESDNLALHVQLCEQRYIQLINKFDHVDKRLDKIEGALVDIKDSMGNRTTATYETYLKWGGGIIFVLSTTVIGLVTHLLLK
jgi:hypothetical protein